MTEQEAITIAKQYLNVHQMQYEEVERAFLVPVSAYDYVPPGLKDHWVVHFKPPQIQEDEFDLLLSGNRVIIVSVDVETKEASLTPQL
jgi:hypothetical protein